MLITNFDRLAKGAVPVGVFNWERPDTYDVVVINGSNRLMTNSDITVLREAFGLAELQARSILWDVALGLQPTVATGLSFLFAKETKDRGNAYLDRNVDGLQVLGRSRFEAKLLL